VEVLEAAEVSEEASEEEALAAAVPLDHGDPSLKLRTMQIYFAKVSYYAKIKSKGNHKQQCMIDAPPKNGGGNFLYFVTFFFTKYRKLAVLKPRFL
jgi:hypothetical protein